MPSKTTLLENTIFQAPPRAFTTTEEADLSCHPENASGYIWIEEDFAVTQVGDKLEAISDNLYRITWNEEDRATKGEFSVFISLQHAIQVLIA